MKTLLVFLPSHYYSLLNSTVTSLTCIHSVNHTPARTHVCIKAYIHIRMYMCACLCAYGESELLYVTEER